MSETGTRLRSSMIVGWQVVMKVMFEVMQMAGDTG